MSRLHRLYKNRFATQNIVDEQVQVPGDKMSIEFQYPTGEQPGSARDNPDNMYGEPMKIEGDEQEPDEKEAASFGVSMHDILSPGEGSWSNDRIDDTYQNDNTREDLDVILGSRLSMRQLISQVEAPYSEGHGPQNTRFDDDDKYNIVMFAEQDDLEKESVALPEGPAMDEDKYGADYGRLDRSIQRDPALEGPLYGK